MKLSWMLTECEAEGVLAVLQGLMQPDLPTLITGLAPNPCKKCGRGPRTHRNGGRGCNRYVPASA